MPVRGQSTLATGRAFLKPLLRCPWPGPNPFRETPACCRGPISDELRPTSGKDFLAFGFWILFLVHNAYKAWVVSWVSYLRGAA